MIKCAYDKQNMRWLLIINNNDKLDIQEPDIAKKIPGNHCRLYSK